ncbi:chromobox protein homolog 1-like isoform X1 [Rhizophagus irregularis DAOM 181602=DAOM 197198]|nr:chromobox protein homolog 1-like isoform X1 [Rhizophagus irregularis DAOM 181602=DAOM 197198]
MSQLENYYKYYSLSRVPAQILKGEEHYNLYKKPLKEKSTERPKVIVWKPNATHQADLAEMPVDPKGFHYFLVVVEVAGKRVDAEPLKDKTANRVLNGFVKIYRRNRIKPPTHRLETDSGSEFTNDQQSYAERAIQAIQEPLLKRMVAQELKTGVTSVEWSEDFHNIVSKTDLLSEGTRVRVKLDEPISVLGVSKCAYTRKELQVVPINEKPPPDSVIRGQPERFVPEQILRYRIRKGQDQYLVKWERYPDTEATWEPADQLKEDISDLIRKFWK